MCGIISFQMNPAGMIPSSALLLPGPADRTLSINEEELEGSFRKWNSANKGPEELFKPEVLCFRL